MKIKIGAFEYDIVVTDRDDNGLLGNSGTFIADKNKIYIANNSPKQKMEFILWHEIAHALMFSTHFGDKVADLLGEYNESFINALADSLQRLCVENNLKEIVSAVKKQSIEE